jgi:hypothetical protein
MKLHLATLMRWGHAIDIKMSYTYVFYRRSIVGSQVIAHPSRGFFNTFFCLLVVFKRLHRFHGHGSFGQFLH